MVTCYIDSLLFAMFARLDSFESILSVEFQDPATNQLAILLRFWVNMLRTGKLITVDIVKHIQEALADCGWSEAKLIRQQDVSEAFTFITDKFALPLLKLKMDVYHTGKESMDDHRIVQERLLDVAIPEEQPADGTDVKLEDCLESFFNNKIEVTRLLQRRNTISTRPKFDFSEKGASSHVEALDPVEGVERRVRPRVGTQDSLFCRRKLDLMTPSVTVPKAHKDDMDVSYGRKSKDSATVWRKEVLIPAWQFFHLIPWFQAKPIEGEPTTDAQVASHFSQRRPVLGICLKRYKITKDGPKRVDTFIDIPLEIRLPHFISDGTEDDGFGSSFSTFKLSLQSVICHRGSSLNAGHYVSIVKCSTAETRTDNDIPSQFQWLMHDDLAKERITIVDIRKALKSECPYLVFYQVQPVDDESELSETELSRSSSEQDEPPTYDEATTTSTPVTHTEAQNSTATITPNTSVSQSPPTVPLDKDESLTSLARIGVLPPVQVPLLTPNIGQSSPSTKPLEHIKSAPPNMEDNPLRPRSLDVPRSPLPEPMTAGRLSSDSNKRSSVAFTENSFIPSNLTSPNEDPSRDGYLSTKGEATGPGTSSPPKKWLRGRSKEGNSLNSALEDDTRPTTKDRSEKRHSRSSWLGVGSMRIRPKSMPPVENRSTTVGDFMKSVQKAMSKDRLAELNPVGEDGDVAAEMQDAMMGETGAPSKPMAIASAKTTPVGKEKKDKDSVKRRKSLRARSRTRLHHANGNEEEGPDRQCAIM